MAERRMISTKVIDTDEFLDMPPSAQCLYFHLNIGADDELYAERVTGAKRMNAAVRK